MKLSILAQFSFLAFPIAIQADSLLTALKKNGASNFAKQIEASSDLLSYYTSSSVKTVYAVLDSNTTHTNSTLRKRADAIQQAQIQTTNDITDLQTYNTKPGGIQETNLKTPKLKGPQVVVPETGVDQNEQSRQRRRAATTNATVPSSPIKIASGLGKKVNLLRGNIAYDGGVIHLVDGEFAVPESLSTTLSATNHTGFQGLLSQGNLSDTFTRKSDITIFTPSNAAIAAASSGNSTSPASLQSLLNNHVIPDFAGYLPALKDGATYKTLAGFDVTITIKNDAYFVNGAKIVSANNILDSGVAHTIDGVLTPPPPPSFTGAGSQLGRTSVGLVGLAAVLVGQVGLVF